MLISGIAEFPNVSVGGATFAILDQPAAQQLFNKPGQLDAIRVQSKPGVKEPDLIAEIQPLLGPTQQVRSGTEQAKKDQESAGSFISFLRYALLAFAGISLFVGAFVIANTLSITIAQRMREFATLRTLGASRRQVLWSVVIEAFVIGLLGSVIGLFLGLGLAKLLNWMFVKIGIDLPHGSTVFATRTVVVSLLVGTLVTLFASIRPARRATRVPPIAAVREGSVLPPSRWAKYGTVTSLTVLALAVVMVSLGALASGIATGPRLLLLGLGVLLLFFGVSMNAAKVVRPLAAVLGAPARTIGGAPGILARDNATRNPARTASTASALMIGLALVTFVAIFGQGIRSSFEGAVNKLFIADYALTSSNTFTPIEAQAGQALVGKPGIHDVTAIRAGSARYLGSNNDLTGVQPNLNKGVAMDWTQGSNAVPGELGNDGFFASKNYVKDHHLSLGSPVTLEFPSGKKTTVKLKGVWDEPKGGSPFAHISISTTLFDKFTPRPADLMVLVEHARRRHRREHGAPRARGEGLCRRQDPDARRVQVELRGPDQQAAQPALRAARAVGDRQPRRDHQHARADGIRANSRARDAARGRDDAASGADDDPLREHRHRVDGCGARDGRRRLPGAARHAFALELRNRVRGALDRARLLRDRGGPGRHPRGRDSRSPRRLRLGL